MQVNNGRVMGNSEIRMAARQQLKGNWGTAILLSLVFMLITGLLSGISRYTHFAGTLINLVVGGPLMLGLISCFIKLVRNEPFRLENLFDGFSKFVTAFLAQLLTWIFIILWSFLLVIPGIIAALRYSMTFYIINDNPEISALDAINESKKMMAGYKWKLFCLYFSFIGWALLCVITFGIGYLWLTPYIQTSMADFYENIKNTTPVKEAQI